MIAENGSLRVWWSSHLPIRKGDLETYAVKNLQDAKEQLDYLSNRDLENDWITDNVGGLEVSNNGEWEEWENEDGDNIDDVELNNTVCEENETGDKNGN